VLHFLLDLGMGIVAWLALRDGESTGGVEMEQQTEVQSDPDVEAVSDRAEPVAPDPVREPVL
jgi:hypothetical protein